MFFKAISYGMFFKAIQFFFISEILVGNSLFVFLMDCQNFSVSTKNKYSILKYISSLLVLDNQTTLLHGYNFINKRNKTQKYFLSK